MSLIVRNDPAWVALLRFGMGPKPGSVARIGRTRASAIAACKRELQNPRSHLISSTNDLPLPTETEAARSFSGSSVVADQRRQKIFRDERTARYIKHLEPDVGFVERLVLFWSNHFSMSRSVLYGLGQWERDVIRPNVLGKFPDMLRGVIQHFTMLRFLDNVSSTGPNSFYGRRQQIGINENLAREILELHTLGEGGGYTQRDIRELALAITGWKTNGDGFLYDKFYHEPGTRTVMGKTYAEVNDTNAQGLAILGDLAVHSSTAKHIAFKLLFHFVTNSPTPRMVNRLATVFEDTGGDLKKVAEELLDMPESWTAPRNRIQLPYVWLVSQARALDFRREHFLRVLATTPNNIDIRLVDHFDLWLDSLFHNPWGWLTPDGFPDEGSFWMNGDAIRLRSGVANLVLSRGESLGTLATTDALGSTAFSRLLSAKTVKTMEDLKGLEYAFKRDELKGRAAWNLAFMSPEFLYR
jgi:uncharacterized protein (DUF1800 family)